MTQRQILIRLEKLESTINITLQQTKVIR